MYTKVRLLLVGVFRPYLGADHPPALCFAAHLFLGIKSIQEVAMKASNHFILREIAGEYLLVPVGAAAAQFNGLITMNETARTIFLALGEERTLEELTAMVTAEYEVDTETARGDVEEFIDQLRQVGALVENEV